jgi:hypothetical protein
MPTPRIFISSTCYDLKYIRENLKFFVRTLGYEPVLSEEGAVFYDPKLHSHDACLVEVPSCQILVLIIGGRYGSKYKGSDKSITNEEYHSAVKAKIPIFALVERGVLDEYRVYKANLENTQINAANIRYPAVDSTKIFDFIDEVAAQTVNNSLVPFADYEEMQAYLKQQWSSMMYKFLTSEGEAKRTSDILSAISSANERIEFLTRRMIDSVGDSITKVTVELYDIILKSQMIGDLTIWRLTISPQKILKNKTLDEFCGGKIKIAREEGYSITGGGPPYELSKPSYEANAKEYAKVREQLLLKLKERNISLEDYLQTR